MGRASDWRAENDRLLDKAEAEDRLREAQEEMDALLERPQVYTLEGELRRTHHHDELLDGKWVQFWMQDTLPELREGRRVRITIEEVE